MKLVKNYTIDLSYGTNNCWDPFATVDLILERDTVELYYDINKKTKDFKLEKYYIDRLVPTHNNEDFVIKHLIKDREDIIVFKETLEIINHLNNNYLMDYPFDKLFYKIKEYIKDYKQNSVLLEVK